MSRNALNSLTILHLIESAGGGGAETVVAGLASARGDRAAVASLRTGWLQETMQANGVPFIQLPYPRRSDILLALRIAQLARRTHADIVHCHCLTMNTVGALGAALARTQSIATVHGLVYDLATKKRLLAYRAAGVLHRRIVTVSKFLRTELNQKAGIPLARINAIYNGVHFEWSEDDRERIRSEFKFGESDFVIGSVAMLRPEKGYPDLLHAVKLALDEIPSLKLLIVGDGMCRSELEELSSNLGLRGTAIFASFRNDVQAVLRAMDLFVLSSHTEGLSIATIEAMGCGIPVIVTDCGGPAEIVTDSTMGVTIPPRDPRAMAAAIIDLARDPERRARLAHNGRTRVTGAFLLEKTIADYEALYTDICAGGGARG